MYYANGVVEELKNSSQLVIFGAGLVGYEVVNCLLTGPYQLSIDFIMVSHQENNPDQIMGIPVIDLASAKHLVQFDATILVATMEKHLESICKNLERNNYFHIIPLTFESDLWSLLQGNYYREMQLSSQKNYLTLEEEVQQVHSKKKQAEEKNKTEKKNTRFFKPSRNPLPFFPSRFPFFSLKDTIQLPIDAAAIAMEIKNNAPTINSTFISSPSPSPTLPTQSTIRLSETGCAIAASSR